MRFLAAAVLLTLAFAATFSCIGMAQEAQKEVVMDQGTKTALFAGGCFWCVESLYEGKDGVIKVMSGYAGGHVDHPTYEQVSAGTTGHREVVEVTYDSSVISYETLLDIFWRNIDPFDADGQFVDKGPQYQSAVFAADDGERALAEATKKALEEKHGKKVVTDILPAAIFWPAEEYHQDYHSKNPLRYNLYKKGSGRDKRLDEIWDGKE